MQHLTGIRADPSRLKAMGLATSLMALNANLRNDLLQKGMADVYCCRVASHIPP